MPQRDLFERALQEAEEEELARQLRHSQEAIGLFTPVSPGGDCLNSARAPGRENSLRHDARQA
jgi:hypothetical protein